MAVPDFLQLRCTSTENPTCAGCPRDFIVPVAALDGIYKDTDGKALISIKGCHYCPDPHCDKWLRFIHTSLTWAEVLALLDGKVENLGNCNMRLVG